MSAIVVNQKLPASAFESAWDAIKIPQDVRTRLVAQCLLALSVRESVPFEVAPLHGLILLSGPPGTGKTTLARGLANRVAQQISGTQVTFLQVDPHELVGSSLGKSQREVTKLFTQTIPESAGSGVCIVLLDEIETLAADRQRLSLEANPIDVHRATDAVLAGLDLLTRQHPRVLIIATTNFPEAVDRALISRADWVEEIGLPDAEARKAILEDMLDHLSRKWTKLKGLKSEISSLVKASEGLDGRQLRKSLIAAATVSPEVARDLNLLTASHISNSFRAVLENGKKKAA